MESYAIFTSHKNGNCKFILYTHKNGDEHRIPSEGLVALAAVSILALMLLPLLLPLLKFWRIMFR